MSKKDTIARLAPAFLKGKSQEFIDRFYAKEESKQYSSIMTWRRKQRQAQKREATARDIVEYLHETQARLNALPSINESDIESVENEAKSLLAFLDRMREKLRHDEIRELQRQQEAIAQRLQQLRGEREPGLFDDM